MSAEATFFEGPSCSQIWSFSPVGPHSLCIPPQRCIWSPGRAVTRVWQVGPYHPPNLKVLLLLLLLLCTGPHHPPDLAPSNCTTTPHPQWRSLPVSLLANKTGKWVHHYDITKIRRRRKITFQAYRTPGTASDIKPRVNQYAQFLKISWAPLTRRNNMVCLLLRISVCW